MQGASTLTGVFAEGLKETKKVLSANEHNPEVEMLLMVGAERVVNVSDEVVIGYMVAFQLRAEVVLLAAINRVGV